MTPLPQARLGTALRCFAYCRVSFAGSFAIDLTGKRYLSLLTCVSTPAVHLEIAYSLDTASFLSAFPERSPDVGNRR